MKNEASSSTLSDFHGRRFVCHTRATHIFHFRFHLESFQLIGLPKLSSSLGRQKTFSIGSQMCWKSFGSIHASRQRAGIIAEDGELLVCAVCRLHYAPNQQARVNNSAMCKQRDEKLFQTAQSAMSITR
jgi:hypothetical protein